MEKLKTRVILKTQAKMKYQKSATLVDLNWQKISLPSSKANEALTFLGSCGHNFERPTPGTMYACFLGP